MDQLLGGMTIKTRTLESGETEASSPNYPGLTPVVAESAQLARFGFQRRLMAYAVSNQDVDKANAVDVSGTSRDRRTCG
jgi:hypothetical protein